MPPTNPMPRQRRIWSRDELLLVFRLYCNTPFGRLHRNNPDIIRIAQLIDRTPSAVAMKAVNFASLDPIHQERGVVGLSNASADDTRLWRDFQENPEEIAAIAERVYAEAGKRLTMSKDNDISIPDGPSETTRFIRTRRVQSFFRMAVLVSYGSRCALSGIALPELLNASHIIPWKINKERRADPTNGLALNVLFDRAFDRGLITFDEKCRTVLSGRLRRDDATPFQKEVFLRFEGQPLRSPTRFAPDPAAMRYHREHIFF
jgi:putative restriction endonuclease